MNFFPFKSTYKASPDINLKGHRALVITTSYKTLDIINKKTNTVVKKGKATGVYASEMTDPYYVFLDAGMDVDVASIRGGKIPVEPASLGLVMRTEYDSRFLKGTVLQQKTKHSKKIDDVDFMSYDIIFMAGGWGAAYDLAQSKILSEKLSQAYAAKKILGGVCHGPLGFIGATNPDGSPLVKGVTMTAVTDRQVKQLGIKITPKHPETELRKEGANFKSTSKRFIEFFNNHVEVDKKHRVVTGQNQKGGIEASEKAMKLLLETIT